MKLAIFTASNLGSNFGQDLSRIHSLSIICKFTANFTLLQRFQFLEINLFQIHHNCVLAIVFVIVLSDTNLAVAEMGVKVSCCLIAAADFQKGTNSPE